MIQRIQTIYLVLAGIFPAFTFFLPLLRFAGKGFEVTMYGTGFKGNAPADLMPDTPYALVLAAVIAVAVPIVTVFRFNNRRLQLKLADLALCADILWYAAAALYAWSCKGALHAETGLAAGVFAPMLAVIAILLAKRAIRRDEALVRAADRIR